MLQKRKCSSWKVPQIFACHLILWFSLHVQNSPNNRHRTIILALYYWNCQQPHFCLQFMISITMWQHAPSLMYWINANLFLHCACTFLSGHYLFPVKYTLTSDWNSWVITIFWFNYKRLRDAANQWRHALLGLCCSSSYIFLLLIIKENT